MRWLIKTCSRKDVSSALHDSGVAYGGSDDWRLIFKTDEANLLEDIEYIESNVCKLGKSKVTCFSSKKERFTGRLLFHSTKAGDHVLSMLAIPVEEIVRQYPLHKFNPYVDAFIRCLDLYFPYRLPWWLDLRSDQDVLEAVELLNRLVTSIRVEINNAEFVKELAKSERVTNKNFRELMKYTDSLFDVCARMLVLRIDLSYRNMYSGHDGAEREVSYEDVRSHREALFSYLKKDALRDCFVGYAWKLEYGLDKGYHYHVLLFLDGSKVREDVTITKVISEHWKNEITGGKGFTTTVTR